MSRSMKKGARRFARSAQAKALKPYLRLSQCQCQGFRAQSLNLLCAIRPAGDGYALPNDRVSAGVCQLSLAAEA